jgi:hypothetical protein
MWFCAIYAIGAILGIVAVALDLGRFVGGDSMGGMAVSRGKWLTTAAPLVATVAVLMAVSAIGLWRHRRWARTTFMCIWPVIAIYGVLCGLVQAVPWMLAIRAVINAAVVGLISAWLFFRYHASVSYFAPRSAMEED